MYDVRNFGAAGDGMTPDTQAIQTAIAACGAAGGGTVIFPAGAYVTGALSLRDHVTLHLEAGATLLGSEDPADYPVIHSRWEGVEQETYAPLIGGCQLEGIAIPGRGTVDGRGAGWWQRFRASRVPQVVLGEERLGSRQPGEAARWGQGRAGGVQHEGQLRFRRKRKSRPREEGPRPHLTL